MIKTIINANPSVGCDDESSCEATIKPTNRRTSKPSGAYVDRDPSPEKLNSVSEYKKAIMNLGRKNTIPSNAHKQSPQKNAIDKVIVTEDEYSVSDKWLIDDLTLNDKGHKNMSTKRKISKSYENEQHEGSDRDTHERSRSPKSTKRLKSIENYDKNKQRSNDSCLNDLIDTEEDFSMAKSTPHGNNSDFDSRLSIYDSNDYNESLVDIQTVDDIDINVITLKSPTKLRALNFRQPIKAKKQLKINKMDTFGLRSLTKKQSSFSDENNSNSVDECHVYEPTVLGPQQQQNSGSSVEIIKTNMKSNWKIKANIESRNLLIPIM